MMSPDSLRQRIAQTLGFRLAVYYAIVFVASVLTISTFAYLLLERSLVARDHELIQVKLADYTNREEELTIDGPGLSENKLRRSFGLTQRHGHGGRTTAETSPTVSGGSTGG